MTFEAGGLQSALAGGSAEQMARAAVQACADGATDGQLAATFGRAVGPAWASADGEAMAGAVDAAAMAAGAGDRRGFAWACAFGLARELLADRATPTGAASGTLQALAAACGQPMSGGRNVVVAARGRELAQLAGDGPEHALGAPNAPADNLDAYDAAWPARRSAWAGQLPQIAGLRDDTKARAFVEHKFRVHLLDGGVDGALRAMLRAAQAGVPHELLAGSLVLAAAERLLRGEGQPDDWALHGQADLERLVILASEIRRLRGTVAGEAWLELLLYGAGRVAWHAPLDKPQRERRDLPEPAALHQTWDHGPEIAKIHAALAARRADDAIAVLRGYLLLGLPEQPLCDQLRQCAVDDWRGELPDQGRCVSLWRAAIDEYCAAAGHPQRDLILAAAMRAACTPQPPRRTARRAELAWQQAHLGAKPRPLLA